MRVGVQQHLPRGHSEHVTAFMIGVEAFRLTVRQREDGAPGEVLIGWETRDAAAAGLVDGYASAITLGLEHGVPLADLLGPGLGLRFDPGGRTDDPEVPHARSVVDYVSRRLAIDWMPCEDRAALGVLTSAERARPRIALVRGLATAPAGPARVTGPRPAIAS